MGAGTSAWQGARQPSAPATSPTNLRPAECQALGFGYRPTDVLGYVPDPHYTPPPVLPRPLRFWQQPPARPVARATHAAAPPAAGGRRGWRQRLGQRWLPYAQAGVLLALMMAGLLLWRPWRGGGSQRRLLGVHLSPRHPSPKLMRAGSKPPPPL